jgi:hypothetical protein
MSMYQIRSYKKLRNTTHIDPTCGAVFLPSTLEPDLWHDCNHHCLGRIFTDRSVGPFWPFHSLIYKHNLIENSFIQVTDNYVKCYTLLCKQKMKWECALSPKVTNTSDSSWVLDTSAHLLPHVLMSQLASDSWCTKYSVTSSVKQMPLLHACMYVCVCVVY